MNYKVRKSAFLKWYFEDENDMGERVFDSLFSDGTFTITTEDLFDECAFIPKDICEGETPAVWPNKAELLMQEEVELIAD